MQHLKKLTIEAMPIFRNNGIEIKYKRGQLFVRTEDEAQGIYYLDCGKALIYSSKNDGDEHLLGIFEEGAIFGKVGSIMSQRQTEISIEALTNCTVFRMNCDQFKELLESDRRIFEAYMRQVSYNNVFLINQLLVLGEKNIYTRILAELQLLSDYYGEMIEGGCRLRIRLTQEELSNMLCISREYLNKTLKTLKAKSLVKIDDKGQILIPDMSRLCSELEESEK